MLRSDSLGIAQGEAAYLTRNRTNSVRKRYLSFTVSSRNRLELDTTSRTWKKSYATDFELRLGTQQNLIFLWRRSFSWILGFLKYNRNKGIDNQGCITLESHRISRSPRFLNVPDRVLPLLTSTPPSFGLNSKPPPVTTRRGNA